MQADTSPMARGTPYPDLERAARAIEDFLDAIGHPSSSSSELAGTPERVAEAFGRDLLDGYASSPKEILADTCATAGHNELVHVQGIAVTVTCPHHLLPSTGTASVAYRPGPSLAGFGALGRLVQCHGRRLALQETVAREIATSLVTHLGAVSAGCRLELRPTCMIARGDRQVGARAVTVAFAGREDQDLRRMLAA